MKETFNLNGKDYEFKLEKNMDGQSEGVSILINGWYVVELYPNRGLRLVSYFYSEDFPYDDNNDGRIKLIED